MCGHCGCETKLITLEENILAENNQYAQTNREFFNTHNILSLNFVSSPGSGKTSLLVQTIEDLKNSYTINVIEGDQQTDIDKNRIEATGISAVQINTGTGCHLDGHGVGHAVETLNPSSNSLLFIENVGNLVCPALFDLGEHHKITILSVTEGEDKPLKYPHMFHHSDLMIINKIDLLPYVDFNLDRCMEYAKQINPNIAIITLSVKTKLNLNHFYDWLETAYKKINNKLKQSA